MTQAWPGQLNAATDDGQTLVDRWNPLDTALRSTQFGTSRPAGITTGGIWSRDNGDATVSLMQWDGTTDHELARKSYVDSFFASGSETSGNWQRVLGTLWQWGYTTAPVGAGAVVTFPIPFAEPPNVTATPFSAAGPERSAHIFAVSATEVNIALYNNFSQQVAISVYWQAIGAPA